MTHSHTWLVHDSDYHRNDDWPNCMFCDGGLSACTVCGGTEGSLTEHCPGSNLDTFTLDKVYTTDLDFVNGQWVRNPYKKMFLGLSVEEARAFWKENYEDQDSMGRSKFLRGW